jgi:hypothetical protein
MLIVHRFLYHMSFFLNFQTATEKDKLAQISTIPQGIMVPHQL